MAIEVNNSILQNLAKPRSSGRQPVPVDKASVNTINQASPATKTETFNPSNDVSRQSFASEGNSQAAVNTSSSASQVADIELKEISRSVQAIQRQLEFRIDDESGRTVITVRDSSSQEVIRQIPSEQLLELSARLKELESFDSNSNRADYQGLLFTTKT